VGTVREYLRFTPVELRRALDDPTYAGDRLGQISEAWDDEEPEEARCLGVDKAWSGIDLVLDRAGLSTALVNGVVHLVMSDDYGAPSYLRPDEVATAAERLAVLPIAELVDGLDPEVVRAEDPYLLAEWSADDRDYVTYHGERLQRFFTAAAKAGDAIIVTFA